MAMNANQATFDSLKAELIGRNAEVLSLCGLGAEYDDGKHHTDPVSGSPKWRISDPVTMAGGVDPGGVRWTNPIDMVAYVWGIDANEAKKRIAEHFRIGHREGNHPPTVDPKPAGNSQTPFPAASSERPHEPETSLNTLADDGYSSHTSSLKLTTLNERELHLFAPTKKLSVGSLKACGVVRGNWKQFPNGRPQHVFAIPTYRGRKLETVNYTMYAVSCRGVIDVRRTDANKVWKSYTETKYAAYSGHDRVGFAMSIESRRMLLSGEPVPNLRAIKVEGITDLLCAENLLEIESATRPTIFWTNSDGARSTQDRIGGPDCILELFDQIGVIDHYVLHDRDVAGVEGSIKWANVIARPAMQSDDSVLNRRVSIIELPMEYSETKGKDLRDWVATGEGNLPALENLISTAKPHKFDRAIEEKRQKKIREREPAERIDMLKRIETQAQAAGIRYMPDTGGDRPETIEEKMARFGVSLSIPNSELRRSQEQDEYVIDNALVRNQPAVIAGPSKAMKTTIGIDLAISLATGANFLGYYRVNKTERILFLTAEIGKSTARKTESRIATSKQVFAQLDNDSIHWQTWVPFIPDTEQLSILRYEIERTKATIVILDPLYQMLDGSTAASYSLNGQQLRTISELCLNAGATPIIIDHCKRSSENAKQFSPLELEDISGAGKAEFFRQWFLVSRRTQFDPERPHELWLSIGGSAGHANLIGLTIDDRVDAATGERGYTVSTESGRETRETMAESRSSAKERRKEEARKAVLAARCEKTMLGFVGNLALTKSKIETLTGFNSQNCSVVIAELLRTNRIWESEEKISGVIRSVFRATKPEKTDHPTAFDSIRHDGLLTDAVGGVDIPPSTHIPIGDVW